MKGFSEYVPDFRSRAAYRRFNGNEAGDWFLSACNEEFFAILHRRKITREVSLRLMSGSGRHEGNDRAEGLLSQLDSRATVSVRGP